MQKENKNVVYPPLRLWNKHISSMREGKDEKTSMALTIDTSISRQAGKQAMHVDSFIRPDDFSSIKVFSG